MALSYPIDASYEPICSKEEMSVEETLAQYYERSYLVAKTILDRHKQEGERAYGLLLVC